jgi:hypothetical protein
MVRSKNRIQNPYIIYDFYKAYKKNIEVDSPYFVTYKQYSTILNLYYKGLSTLLIEHGRAIKLPCNLGVIKIVKKKMKFSNPMYATSIDWESTRKYKKVIHHINEHSGGYKYLFMWDKQGAYLTNISKYKFVPIRDSKRKLAFYIKNKVRDYFEQ